ncbi:MAG TPA: hypothetical protein ENF57_02975 [Candidatus Korarchaeota archaeon]|nr:hypothetical protein [Candidatus Korarchaeota archaeon]
MFEIVSKGGKLSVASHGEDLDGLFSAALILLVQPEGISLHFTAPYEIKDSPNTYDIVLDLPPPMGGTKILVDHHESNLSMLNRVERAYLRPEYPSTARLLYDILRKWEPSVEEYSRTVELVDETDTGNLDFSSALFTSAVRKVFKLRRRDLEKVARDLLIYPPVTSEDLTSLPSIKGEIDLIEREYGEQVREVLVVGGGDALLVQLRSLPSYLVPILQLVAQKYKFFGTITTGSDGALRLSLRSRPDSPLSALEVAEAFGGGGHKNAAGALMMPSSMYELLTMIREHLEVELITV